MGREREDSNSKMILATKEEGRLMKTVHGSHF